jgi:hypothetical protein
MGKFLSGIRLLGLVVALLAGSLPAGAGETQKIAMQEPPLLRGGVQVRVKTHSARLERLPDLEPGQRLLIDNQTRLIGGAVDRSQGVQRQLPAQKFPFFMDAGTAKGPLTLTIGYLRGLNTPEAHVAGQSQASFVSSPAVVKVNGVRVGYLYVDGELIRVEVPRSALKPDGFNVLQIEAGFYFLPGNRVAYDELELQHLALVSGEY